MQTRRGNDQLAAHRLVPCYFGLPRLLFASPEMRCGKTTALGVLRRLSFRALQAANISTAAVFRTIEAMRPTLLIDEADTFLAKSDELRGVVNSGHERM